MDTPGQTKVPRPAPPTLAETLAKRKALRRIDLERKEHIKPTERLAVWISDRVGTPSFFFLIVLWTFGWLGWNAVAPKHLRFDPFPAFVLWLFLSNVIQIFLMPLIMVAQNLQGRHADQRAENDYEINLQAEDEIETVLNHLSYQNAILITMLEQQGLTLDDVTKRLGLMEQLEEKDKVTSG